MSGPTTGFQEEAGVGEGPLTIGLPSCEDNHPPNALVVHHRLRAVAGGLLSRCKRSFQMADTLPYPLPRPGAPCVAHEPGISSCGYDLRSSETPCIILMLCGESLCCGQSQDSPGQIVKTTRNRGLPIVARRSVWPCARLQRPFSSMVSLGFSKPGLAMTAERHAHVSQCWQHMTQVASALGFPESTVKVRDLGKT